MNTDDATGRAITIPAEQLYLLGLILADTMKAAPTPPPGFAEGWLACCGALREIGDEQSRRGLLR